MASTNRPSVDQLKRALELTEKIHKLEAELAALLGSSEIKVRATPGPKPGKKRKVKISAEGLANIIAAQKRRWAKVKRDKKASE